jgi:hypothetical protein
VARRVLPMAAALALTACATEKTSLVRATTSTPGGLSEASTTTAAVSAPSSAPVAPTVLTQVLLVTTKSAFRTNSGKFSDSEYAIDGQDKLPPLVAAARKPDGSFLVVAQDGPVPPVTGGQPGVSLHPANPLVAAVVAASACNLGVYELLADGSVAATTGLQPLGAVAGPLDASVKAVALAATADCGGYWIVTDRGDVFGFGSAPPVQGVGALAKNGRVTAAIAAPGGGLWLAGADGGVFALGGAGFFGSSAGLPLNAPIVSIVATPSGKGYALVAADGGIFNYGDAAVQASTTNSLRGGVRSAA